ncbi:MAG: UDP-N-acetylglucosamine 1-carboxyvinyltransferase [Oscillospiraceae bacterium]
MERYIVNGKKPLKGEIDIQGAKNAALPILAATLLVESAVISNCPYLSDVRAAEKILNYLGCDTTYGKGTLKVKNDNKDIWDIPDELMREMRSSIVFLGAIISKCKKARLSFPGGCELGPRPIDMHLWALSKLGVKIKEDHGFLDCSAPKGLFGAKISLPFPSVGTTENIILASVTAQGETVINNAAREPEIIDLARFLNKCGAKIKGEGSSTIVIEGVPKLKSGKYSVMPDRIVSATYLSYCAITGGEIILNKCDPEHLSTILPVLEEMGCCINVYKDMIYMKSPKSPNCLKPVSSITTMPYPGFPTDALAPIMSLTTVCDGTSVFIENIFENRYRHAAEMAKMGADIKVSGKIAVVKGVKQLHSANVFCTDLRGGAALVGCALCAEGESKINDIYHILRGYEGLEKNLQQLGADIILEHNDEEK